MTFQSYSWVRLTEEVVTNEVTTLMVNQFTKRDKKVTLIALIGKKIMTQTDQRKQVKKEKLIPNMTKKDGIEIDDLFDDIEYDDASFDGVEIDYTTQS